MRTGNLFGDCVPPSTGERFETLLDHRNVVVERIVSSVEIEPEVYSQPQDEWVVLVQGEAILRIADDVFELNAGDHVFIPANVAHTVERVSAGALWLAVHLYPE